MFQKFLRFLSGIIDRFITKDVTEKQDQAERYLSNRLFSAIGVLARDIADESTADSPITVSGDNARAEYLNEQLQEFCLDLPFAVQRMAGTGGVILKPYTTGYNNKIEVDILPQSRFVPTSIIGQTATAGYFLSDTSVYNKREVALVEYHEIDLETKLYTIRRFVLDDGKETRVESVPEWKNLPPEQTLLGVDRLMFGFLRSPADDKKDTKGWYGVPLDYGSEDLETLIQEQLKRIGTEYSSKEGWIGVDQRLFDKDGNIPKGQDKFFKMLTAGGKADEMFWREYSPDIRDQSLISGFMQYLSLYEKSVGVSPGFFTTAETGRATATEIISMQRQTFNTVDKIRKSMEAAVNDLVYAINVIADVNGLAMNGPCEIVYDWDYSMRESSTERWQQLKDGVAMGTVDKPEVRAWSENEDIQAAREAVAAIVPLSDVAAGIYSHEEYLAAKEGITVEQARAKMPSDDDLVVESELAGVHSLGGQS